MPMNWTGRRASVAGLVFASLMVASETRAQGRRGGEPETAQGRVRSLTTAPMGEVDGAVLDDGTVIHWPPHLADRFSAVVARGERIRVAGRMETGPAGDTHLEAATVTNFRTNASVENDFGPPPPAGRRPGPPPPPRGPRRAPGPRFGERKTAEGLDRSLTTAPRGEVDGAILEDGTVIHWPPHLADRFTAVVARRDRVTVNGWMETGPAGDTHLEVQTASNLRSGASVANDEIGPPMDIPSEDSSSFLAAPGRPDSLERRLKELEDQVTSLREELRGQRHEP